MLASFLKQSLKVKLEVHLIMKLTKEEKKKVIIWLEHYHQMNLWGRTRNKLQKGELMELTKEKAITKEERHEYTNSTRNSKLLKKLKKKVFLKRLQ